MEIQLIVNKNCLSIQEMKEACIKLRKSSKKFLGGKDFYNICRQHGCYTNQELIEKIGLMEFKKLNRQFKE